MKKLKVDAALLDLRRMQPAALEGYDAIEMSAAMVLTSPRSQSLLQQYPVQLECAMVQNCEEDVVFNTINGKLTLNGCNDPAGKQILMVNGKLAISPDAGDVLRRYVRIIVNGKVSCPRSLVPVVGSQCMVNGKVVSYPDGAVVLGGSTAKLNKNFLLRAEGRLYWHEKMFIAADPKLDPEAPAAKGARFTAPRAILIESLAERLAPLFTEDTELIVVPDGTAVVEEDLELSALSQRRYGSRLYVLGDVTIPEERPADLSALEYLKVEGAVLLPSSQEEAFCTIPELEYERLRTLNGHLLAGRPMVQLSPETLALYPEGVACADCASVILDPALEPDTIAKKLCFDGCAQVRCTKLQQNAVAAVCQDVAQIQLSDADAAEQEGELTCLSGAQLAL